MKDLSFLKSATLEEVPANAPSSREGVSTLVKQPTTGDLRVFKNGRCYPSDAFAEKNQLAYAEKVETVDPETGEVSTTVLGNGLDIFSSTHWGMVKGLPEEVIFLCAVPRQGNMKIDLYGSCQYEGTTPKTSILEQGASSFGKSSLVEMLASAYAVNWEVVKFVDIEVNTDYPMVSDSGVYHLPKIVSRGENRGKATYIRRENIDIFPIQVVYTELKDKEEAPVEAKAETPAVEVDSQKLFQGDPLEEISKGAPESTMEVVGDTNTETETPAPVDAASEEPVATTDGGDDLLASLL